MATYFLCSACGSDDRFACEVYRFQKTVEDPDESMVSESQFAPPEKHNRIIHKAAYIDNHLYADSISRRTKWWQMFGYVPGSRFHLNFGRYAVIKYLTTIIDPSDTIIVGSPIYTASLVRGTLMPIDQYEHDLIDICYQYNVFFTGNTMAPALKQDILRKRIPSVPLSNKTITQSDLTGWILS